ncbi:MAG: flavoprotein [Acutalibacteraceae bacterium]
MVKTNYENRIRLLRLLLHPCPIAAGARTDCVRRRGGAADLFRMRGEHVHPLRTEYGSGPARGGARAADLRTISEAEDKITRGRLDALVVAPCTGNTLGKIPYAITDGRSRWPSKPICATPADAHRAGHQRRARRHAGKHCADHRERTYTSSPSRRTTRSETDLARLRLPSAARRARLCAARRAAPARAGRAPTRIPKRLTRRPKRLTKQRRGGPHFVRRQPPTAGLKAGGRAAPADGIFVHDQTTAQERRSRKTPPTTTAKCAAEFVPPRPLYGIQSSPRTCRLSSRYVEAVRLPPFSLAAS